ncbi:YciI family protein [Vogesella oryzae]|uniref:YciI family protein n=1 Tax=Vogesella oryzae TaxID=1735285 RepID=UPI001581E559|nr:YciI family protein [Vogesella oryzae]
MYVVSLSYTAPLNRIDELVPAHIAWLQAAYRDGLLLASGRKLPRTGGVILARRMPREQLDALLAQDPFRQAGVAEYSITEFAPSMSAPELAQLLEPN